MAFKRLGPGVYSDGDTLHLVIPELLEANGYEVNPDTVAALTKAAEGMAAQLGAGLEIHE